MGKGFKNAPENCQSSCWGSRLCAGEEEVSLRLWEASQVHRMLILLNRPPTPFAVKPIGAFYVFLGANILAALYAPIQDCDETFNYWEPTHYLSHGYGLQTWEYSPDYAIRSWLYIAFHALIGNFRRLLPHPTKVKMFAPMIDITLIDSSLGNSISSDMPSHSSAPSAKHKCFES